MISNHFRGLIAEDTPAGNDGDTPGFAQPVSQTEIEELLYGDDWPAVERLARLLAIRDELSNLEATDFGDDDPRTLIGAIDEAVAQLNGLAGEGMDPTSVDHDPAAHRETLSPDSDELEAIEAADEASLEDEPESAIDKSQWIDGDGLERGEG
ncbi:hypothetical protein [Devosia sp. Root105]|uniref:hypothetical protein n=1 Tax=Devosia sp. Root105 TaxID=1736423 RepID=UPI0006FD75AC|nr:hypothetical protein [Devosia sp. Root105]KQU94393.1 hypothetical protein ASC68_22350 [Devosia sp. Root105]